jgi:hypothetical protein
MQGSVGFSPSSIGEQSVLLLPGFNEQGNLYLRVINR